MAALKFFQYEPFHFETLRALWYAPSGGSDLGEVLSAARAIKERDVESWYQSWSALALARAREADAEGFGQSSGASRLRASNYMRTAEFYLPPRDPRRAHSSAFSQTQFFRGLDAIGLEYQRLNVPYDGAVMEAIFLPNPRARTLLLVHGGFDSTPEEMFFMIGRAAQARECDVLIFEGPGQGNLLRKHQTAFDPAWDKCVTAALDAAPVDLTQRSVIAMGVSMGGHFLARAAAREKRLQGIVLCDYFPAPLAAFQHFLPPFMRTAFANKAAWVLNLMELNARFDPQVRWVLDNAMWTFGANTLPELVDRLHTFDEGAWVGDIDAHVLMMLGAGEHFFEPAAAEAFRVRLTNAASVTFPTFSAAEGGELHCRNGAYFLVQNAVFDWLANLDGNMSAMRAPAPVALQN